MAGGKAAEQTFSFEIVSILLAALSSNGETVGNKHYAMMAEMDGSKTQSGYEHMFRAVKARAKEIKKQMDDGQINTAATPKGKAKARVRDSSKTATPGTGEKSGTKRRKTAANSDGGADHDDDESPTKKAKEEIKDELRDDSDEV